MALGFWLGCCATSTCCSGKKACRCICFGPRSCGVKPRSLSRLAYVFLHLLSLSIAFVLMKTLSPKFLENENSDNDRCLDDEAYEKLSDDEIEAQEVVCYRIMLVHRMTFALFIFHAFIILLTCLRNDFAALIHDGAWVFKLMLISGIFVWFL